MMRKRPLFVFSKKGMRGRQLLFLVGAAITLHPALGLAASPSAYDQAEASLVQAYAMAPAPGKALAQRTASLADQTITGKVTSAASGEALPGVTVLVKGTQNGVSTDAEGKFSLSVPDAGAVLLFSYIGHVNKEVTVGSRSVVNVALEEDAKALEEVVVVGYATQKKVNVSGSVAMVTSEVLANRPVTSVSSALQGSLPGLTAVSASGFPGASGASLRVRGTGTLNNSNPFIVVDGIPDVDINSLNPEDIESVSVLKDAASAAIYGSRAANGVILITTKTGKTGQKPTLSYNGYVGMQKPTRLPKMLGSVEYMEMLNESQRNVNLPITFTPDQIQAARDGSDPDYLANTNWTKELFKDYAPQSSHNVSLNGGSSDLAYFASYGRIDQKGMIVGDKYWAERNNVRLRLNANKLLDLVDLDANLNFVDRQQNQPAGGTDHDSGPIYTTMTMSPLNPVRFSNGKWGYGGGSSNPVAMAIDGGYNNFKSQEFYGTLTGTVHILKNLSLKGQYGLNAINQIRNTFTRKIDYFYPETGDIWYTNRTANQLDTRDYVQRKELLSGILDYNTKLGRHNFNVLAGYQQEAFRYDSWAASEMNFVSDDVPVFNLSTENTVASGDGYHYGLRSFFGRVNYDFDEKYLLELNYRNDGSSRYIKENRIAHFPSASAAWRFTRENFITDATGLSWLTEGKLRASYGSLGNQYGANGAAYSEWYPYIRVINSLGTMPIGYTRTSALAQTDMSNPVLLWERVIMANLGIDLAFLNNRLTFTGDVFDKRTVDIQNRRPLPAVLGLNEPDQNLGTARNRGWELSLGWNDHKDGFRYGLTGQLSDVRNEMIDLGGAAPTIANNIIQVGYPMWAYYGYQTDGLAQVGDFDTDAAGKLVPKFPIFDADKGKVAPGDIKYRDISGPDGIPDGKVTADYDRTVLGDEFPRYTFSLRGDLAYKGFDFNFFLQGVGKANGYLSGPGLHAFYTNGAFPQEIHRDRWTPENPGAWYPRFTYSDNRNSTARLSDYWLQNAAYLRLKNVQLGYTLPADLTRKIRMEKLRFYVSGENLLTKTNFFYAYDPEGATNNGGMYPQVKTLIFGVNISLK
ncbi:MAG: SusC/RagA family TonB-linked outer membrane protein [Adhaeribacter sp.]